MADTIRTLSYLQTSEFQDGQPAGSITPQDMRDFLVSVAAGTVCTNRTVTTTTAMLATDTTIFCNQSAAMTVNLIAPVVGQKLTIKDLSGTAASNNITVDAVGSTTIDGSLTFVLNNNYASVDLVSPDGTNWSIV
jgi:hypothetical protein